MSHSAYKFRIYPTVCQEEILRKTIGCCRYVYNWGLTQRREAWVTKKENIGYSKTAKEMTLLKEAPETSWLGEVSSVCLQQSLRNLDTAFSNFFKKKSAYPSFKARKNGGSARYMDNAFRVVGNELFLAKMKESVKVKWSREISSHPTSVTVSQNASGQWFASFLCEEEFQKLPASESSIGIDLGIETFATLSDGRTFKAPKSVRNMRAKIKRAQKNLSRKRKGSKNANKARVKLARLHQHIDDVRKDFLHKLSTQIVRENQTISIEDLAVARMNKDRKLARLIGEQGWRNFRSMLEYKCEWYGRNLVVIDRFFPSSKTCSCCGTKSAFGLEIRQWKCQSCDTVHSRDVNAAINISAAGQAALVSGEDGRPTKNYVLRGGARRKRKTHE